VTDRAQEAASKKAQHTPGPWEINKYLNYEGFSIYGPDGTGCIAERWWPSKTDIPIEANARLIAAAPEMLLELEHELEELEGWLRDEETPEWTDNSMRIREEKIKQVVAKAKGNRP
jgi:hypothetical protein